MGDVGPGQLCWSPPNDARTTSRMGRFLDRVGERRGLSLPTYADAQGWSVGDLDAFWAEVVDQLKVRFVDQPDAVLADASMPGAVWFPGGTLNYAEHALRRGGDRAAIVGRSQSRDEVVLSHDQLADQVGRAASGLRRLGVGRGDRVVGYLPNVPETMVAFLACASIGAVLVVVRSGVRGQLGGRPGAPDRTEGAAGGGRVPVRREGRGPHSGGGGHPVAPCRRWRRRSCCPTSMRPRRRRSGSRR